jgi:citrate lyase subunit gamma (acyl carrier protein)
MAFAVDFPLFAKPSISKEKGSRMTMQSARVLREAKAGLEERGDVLVCLSPADEGSGVQVDIESTLMTLFGEQIRASVLGVIEEYGLKDVKLTVRDQGALDYAIRARVQTAIERALQEGQ